MCVPTAIAEPKVFNQVSPFTQQRDQKTRLLQACEMSGAIGSEACTLAQALFSRERPTRTNPTFSTNPTTAGKLASFYSEREGAYQFALKDIDRRLQKILEMYRAEPASDVGWRLFSAHKFRLFHLFSSQPSRLRKACQEYGDCLFTEKKRLQEEFSRLQKGKLVFARQLHEIDRIEKAIQKVGQLAEKDDIDLNAQLEKQTEFALSLLGPKPIFSTQTLEQSQKRLRVIADRYVHNVSHAKNFFGHLRSTAIITASCLAGPSCLAAFGSWLGFAASVGVGLAVAGLLTVAGKLYQWGKGKSLHILVEESSSNWCKDLWDATLGFGISLLTLGIGRVFQIGSRVFGAATSESSSIGIVAHRILASALPSSFQKSVRKLEKIVPLFSEYRKALQTGERESFTSFREYSESRGLPLRSDLRDLLFDFGVGVACGLISLPGDLSEKIAHQFEAIFRPSTALGQAALQVAGEKLKRRGVSALRGQENFLAENSDIVSDLFQLVVQEGVGK